MMGTSNTVPHFSQRNSIFFLPLFALESLGAKEKVRGVSDKS